MKKYKYVRLDNIEDYDGWEIIKIIPAISDKFYDMVCLSKEDAPNIDVQQEDIPGTDSLRLKELEYRVNTVIDDMKHFHLIYNEDGKLISSEKGIFAEIRYFIDKLEGTIPTTMTPFEHGLWERENRKNEDTDKE